MKNNKEVTNSLQSMDAGIGINAEKGAEVSNLQTGDKCFDAESKEKEFEKIISETYKKEFTKKVKEIVKARLKEVKGLKETNEGYRKVINLLMKKFNIEDENLEKLEEAVMNIETTKENENERNRQLISALIRENNYLKQYRAEADRMAKIRAMSEKLRSQEEEAKKEYPDFDLKKELEKEEFVNLIRAGVSAKNAYEVTNLQKILDDKAKSAEKMVVDSIRSKGSRPVENGSAPNGAVVFEKNISKLTKKERAELAKRAMRGETINL